MSAAEPRPGFLVPIGGGERKSRDARVLSRLVEIGDADHARVAIIATASNLESTGPQYERVFGEIGVQWARSLAITTRADCKRDDVLRTIEECTVIFFTGGSQLRLSRTLGGTPVAAAIRKANARGAHVAGTSAGASYMSEHMIAFGEQGATPRTHMVALAPGLGLTRDFTIDQHFRERDRLGRLLTALAYNPSVIGMGLDENTAAFIAADRTMEVVGSGSCTLVDGAHLEYASVGKQAGDPVCLLGVRLHILLHGATFNIDRRSATAPPEGSDREVHEP